MPVHWEFGSPFSGASGLIKRASDIVLSLVILALAAPLLLRIPAQLVAAPRSLPCRKTVWIVLTGAHAN